MPVSAIRLVVTLEKSIEVVVVANINRVVSKDIESGSKWRIGCLCRCNLDEREEKSHEVATCFSTFH